LLTAVLFSFSPSSGHEVKPHHTSDWKTTVAT